MAKSRFAYLSPCRGFTPGPPALSLCSIVMLPATHPAVAPPVHRPRPRGPVPLSAAKKRDHCVSVRLNHGELAQLDDVRGRFQRGQWLRMAALDQLPPVVPAVNGKAWAELARLAANLNQAQLAINRGDGDTHQIELLEDLRKAVAALRRGLIGVHV